MLSMPFPQEFPIPPGHGKTACPAPENAFLPFGTAIPGFVIHFFTTGSFNRFSRE